MHDRTDDHPVPDLPGQADRTAHADRAASPRFPVAVDAALRSAGWQPGQTYFRPELVRIEWRTS